MMFGNGQANFWRDVPEAPAQAVKTRLDLVAGEWYLDLAAGTPYQGVVLGKTSKEQADTILRSRILETQGVTQIVPDTFESIFEPSTRTFIVRCEIDTIYGETSIV